jgi:hypothetical protein
MRNIHQRDLAASVSEAGRLIDGLSGAADRMWPATRWPAVRFDRPLGVGAEGGHGPIRYTVVAHAPGRSVEFAFTAPHALHGVHRFEAIELGPARTILRNVVEARTSGSMRLAWPLVWRPLHDALMEDALDRAEAELTGLPRTERRLSPWVRVLRAAIRRSGRARRWSPRARRPDRPPGRCTARPRRERP